MTELLQYESPYGGLPAQEYLLCEKRVQKFLNSRKREDTVDYTRILMKCLIEERAKHIDNGWVRMKTLINELVPTLIPNQTTFYRLLSDLLKTGLIERREDRESKERGRKPVFYRVPIVYPSGVFMNRRELLDDLKKSYMDITKLGTKLFAAELWMSQQGCVDPKQTIMEIIEENFSLSLF
jgi:predicted transcriptional regulator